MVIEKELRSATLLMFERYYKLLIDLSFESNIDKCNSSSLLRLTKVAIDKIDELPIDKLNRWLGFVQGVLVMNGIITVDGERDYSRPLFTKAYKRKIEPIDVSHLT